MARPPKSAEPLTKTVTVRMTQADYDRYIEILQKLENIATYIKAELC